MSLICGFPGTPGGSAPRPAPFPNAVPKATTGHFALRAVVSSSTRWHACIASGKRRPT